MSSWWNWLIVLGTSLLCLTAVIFLTWLLLRNLLKSSAEHSSLVLTRALESVDRALALAASSDALTYQAIRLPEQTSPYAEPDYDPSDAGEVERINARMRAAEDDEESLDDATAAALAEFYNSN